MPSAVRAATASATGCSAPEITVSEGLFTAATTALGALPFAFVRTISHRAVAYSNAIAAGLMLGAWGSCADCELIPCPEDLNFDCVVDGADLGTLLAGWSLR